VKSVCSAQGPTQGIRLPAIPLHNQQGVAQRGSDHLREHAELLIGVLREEGVAGLRRRTDLLELVVDGYAHVLALDVDRRRLERDISRLAGSGDPQTAAELGELSAELQELASASEQLRKLLGDVRARDERPRRH
jgi:hypothetical protein